MLAEAGAEMSPLIQKLRGAKAEQNLSSLEHQLGMTGETLQTAIRGLMTIGFLEEIKSSWKVPMLYVSHLADEVRHIATQVVRIEDGRIAAQGGLELLAAGDSA